MPETFESLIGMARARTADSAAGIGYTFSKDGLEDTATLSYGELDRQARSLAVELSSQCEPGARVLLVLPAGLQFIVSFFGCIYAGLIAVPICPPNPNRPLTTLSAIIKDCQASLVLITDRDLRIIQRQPHHPVLPSVRWRVVDNDKQSDRADEWNEPDIGSTSIALLQYTSGSTATPKGVAITHGNLLHNFKAIEDRFAHGQMIRVVNWLPPYHDMGLIGGILQPMYFKIPITLMQPMTMLMRPARWLQRISQDQADISGGPNFAYELCIEKITPEQMGKLDLSRWHVAFCGAEPIQPRTLQRFAEKFASCGFRQSSFLPCYGLAESTLLVAGGSHGQGRAACRNIDGKLRVSCGHPAEGLDVRIVHPERLTEMPEKHVGEIWISGPSVAAGYWDPEYEMAVPFSAATDTGDGPFLRTGDLGFFQQGELFVTGRRVDLVILRGQNHYPQDIELTVTNSHSALVAGGCAAFTIVKGAQTQLVVLAELAREKTRSLKRNSDPESQTHDIIDAIRESIAREHDISAHIVRLVLQGTLPRTTSGKIRRNHCREMFLDNVLESVG